MSKIIFLLIIATAVSSMLIPQQLVSTLQVYASESSPYQSGYDHGCDDAGRSESDKYINQPEKGPSFHTGKFMNGYYDGLNSCGGSGGFIESEPEERTPRSSGEGINWEDLCNQYGGLVGIKDPCYEYSNGTELTEKGKTALVCLLGGGVTFLASLDPATKAAILELGKRYCP